MDIESDDSERWEDFFGSSTELAPSLLGIYDTLTSTLDSSDFSTVDNSYNGDKEHISSDSNYNLSDEKATLKHKSLHSCDDEDDSADDEKFEHHHSFQVESHKHPPPPEQTQLHSIDSDAVLNCSSNSSNSSSSFTSDISLSSSYQINVVKHNSSFIYRSVKPLDVAAAASNTNSLNSNSNKHRNNICILSPNVQRIITHSDAKAVDTVDINALHHLQNAALNATQSHRFVKKTNSPTSLHKVKYSHIPLSKVTGKLTQSGSELVDTFDSSSEYLDAVGFPQSEKKGRSGNRMPQTPAAIIVPTAVDEEKTPTNNISPFNFDAALLIKSRNLPLPAAGTQESSKFIEMEKVCEQSSQFFDTHQPAKSSIEYPSVEDLFKDTEPNLCDGSVEAINFALVSENLEKLSLNNNDHSIVTNPNVALSEVVGKSLKPVVRSSSVAATGSPLLTYARSKSLAAKANTLGGPVPLKLPTAQQLEELEEASKMSAESLDRLTDIKSKFSPKESRKLSGLMLPEIAKLKHRPLSSSSICSTSSSSSSSSDHLNCKLNTSYLASVESLADQSENELMDPHSGMSVFERACLEIVDSERSYVEDLGQVIRGYLMDWKERACLRYDELRVLFSNIEEIYEFNSTLQKQLINSGMDPVKIAKCFIDLRERFDVYTTYCTSYPEAISLLTKLLQATHTNALLTSTQKMLQHTLPLGSYLLKPVQRILKYHLLLDNLRKHCEVKEVFQAYEIMRQVARDIDQVKRKLEQQSRVKELSGILDGWLGPELTVLGELRQEGLLMEHNKPRMVFLFATMLIITKSKEDNRLQFKSYIHQNNLMLSEHLPGEPTSFYVIPYDEPRNQIKLTAKNRDQKRLWAQHIKGVILEKFDNIPNRAKELVYKLGDEEDRTPDKNIWKWSLHSTPTPVYLERRNQYRRSEIRNRSKFKRKTVTNSSSFDNFNDINEANKTKVANIFTENKSMDDNVLPVLQKLMSGQENKDLNNGDSSIHSESNVKEPDDSQRCQCGSKSTEKCTCILRNQLRNKDNSQKSPIFSRKMLKERSKSVPRISLEMEEEQNTLYDSNTNLNGSKGKYNKSPDIKQYNYKTIPKRIVTLKKQRSSKKEKETSKFYMDLNEFEVTTQTVLKITESKENLLESTKIEKGTTCDIETNHHKLPDVVEFDKSNVIQESRSDPKETLSPSEKAKKDAQIVLDLLKNSKDFEKLYKKQQKRRFTESSTSIQTNGESDDPPPRPPSRSPPPLESEYEQLQISKGQEEEEHVYESLLRNVHVPYKFSPMPNRTKSDPYHKIVERQLPETPLRPESDYVTLIYSPEGNLQKVGEDLVDRLSHLTFLPEPIVDNSIQQQRDSSTSSSSSSSTLKRDSQNTVIDADYSSFGYISQASSSPTEAIYARPVPKNLVRRFLSTNSNTSKSSVENVCSSESSLVSRSRKSSENNPFPFHLANKPPERRVSDVSEMCRQSILHRQGSEAVGERMAHMDYADPKTLFSLMNSEATLSVQRDSVFSLTSSNDSVCEHKSLPRRKSELATNFEYEQNVEDCLENDFRDSAIYSDDNEKNVKYENNGYIKRPSSPPPPPPPTHDKNVRPPELPPKPKNVPPFPGVASALQQSCLTAEAVIIAPQTAAKTVLCQAASRSWVLQQIENFNK